MPTTYEREETMTDHFPPGSRYRLPIAVYGTLRPGHGNSALWQGFADAEHDGDAYALGVELRSNGGFPYAVPATGAESVVALIHPREGWYEQVLERMDRLEGVSGGHYDRVTIGVYIAPERVVTPAWIYVAGDADYARRLRPVPDNDWNHFEQPRFRSLHEMFPAGAE
jgi:gamma-glutamylcyclotransferase (GGCT)/AIG2-like uncharacterized protein YtfP